MPADTDQLTDKLAIVIVTYKRAELLQVLFDSILANGILPWHVYVVDNDKDAKVAAMCASLGTSMKDASRVIYLPQETNTGGSGGFSTGMESAYKDGAEWIWVMDDDVKMLPGAIAALKPWMDDAAKNDHLVIQGQRLNFDGSPFYWQYHFWYRLGIPNPIAPSGFKEGETFRAMNTACFEGSLFHRSIVGKIGAPDKRFFIYWDDTIYGYLASRHTQPILIKDVILQRTRTINNMKLGSVRKLNSASDMVRYHIMRNRAYMAKYVMLAGEYNSVLWGLGTVLTFAKEVIRLFVSKGFKSGIHELIRGIKDGRKLAKDKSWKPMPPLEDRQA
jgi:GT2 family glycosyltransferase